MGQQANDHWEQCRRCGRHWPSTLEGTWSVVRPNATLECVAICECGATLLCVKAHVQTVRLVDIEDARAPTSPTKTWRNWPAACSGSNVTSPPIMESTAAVQQSSGSSTMTATTYLTDLRNRIRTALKDTDSGAYTWTDAELNEHIARALNEFSDASPIETTTTIAAVADAKSTHSTTSPTSPIARSPSSPSSGPTSPRPRRPTLCPSGSQPIACIS